MRFPGVGFNFNVSTRGGGVASVESKSTDLFCLCELATQISSRGHSLKVSSLLGEPRLAGPKPTAPAFCLTEAFPRHRDLDRNHVCLGQ